MSENSEAVENKSKAWQKALNVLIPLTLTILAIVFAIEMGFRMFYQLIPIEVCAADPIIGTYICQPYFEYDNPIRYAYKYEPNFKLEGRWNPANSYLANPEDSTAPTDRDDSFDYLFETDEMGFPNSFKTWDEQYNIVIAGDSFMIRTAPQTWVERLEELRDEPILALGAPSWTTLNEVEAIKQFGLDKNPEWVVLMFFEGNDMITMGEHLTRQESGLDWREYDLQDVPFTRKLLTPHILRYAWQTMFPEPEDVTPKTYRYPVTASTEAGPVETVFKDIHLLPLSADYETLANSDEFAAMGAALLELDELVKAQNGRFLFVYIPSKEHVLWSRIWDETDINNVLERTVTVTLSEGDHGRLQWEPQYLSFDTFTANHNAQEMLLADFTAEADIEFLNLTPIFWQKSIEEGELYHYGDPHWNQAGNFLAAQAIYSYLEENSTE